MLTLQTEPQRDREKTKGQDEHLHHGTIRDGSNVSRDVPEAGQVDGPTDDGAAPEDDPRGRYLIHGRSLQACVSQRSGTQDADTSSKFQLRSLVNGLDPYL